MSIKLYQEENIFATPIVYPMVAKELSRILTQINALHTREDLDRALNAFEKIGKKTQSHLKPKNNSMNLVNSNIR